MICFVDELIIYVYINIEVLGPDGDGNLLTNLLKRVSKMKIMTGPVLVSSIILNIASLIISFLEIIVT